MDKQALLMQKLAATAMSSRVGDGESMKNINPASTKATALSQAKRRAEIQKKQKEQEKTAAADRARLVPDKAAQDKVARAVKAQDALAGRKSKDAEQSMRLTAAKKQMREQERRWEEQKEAMRQRRSNQPMLCEQGAGYQKNASNLALLKATQKIIDMFQEEKLDPKNFLSEQSKQVLEDEALRQQLKEAYKK